MHRQWQIQRGIIADRRFNATLNEGCGQDYIANQNHANTILKTSVGGIILLILGCVFGQVLTQNVMATSYSITYDENVVTNMPVDVAGASYTGTAVVSNVTPARDGYDFLNWCTVFPTNNNGTDACTGGSTYAPGGSYTLSGGSANNLKLYAMWKEKIKTLADITTMQEMTPEVCAATPTPSISDGASTSQYQLKDTRDNKLYYVAKLADGKCWMTQNLDLDLTASTLPLSKDTTDLNSKDNWDPGSTYYTRTATHSSSTYTDMYSWNLGDYAYNGTTNSNCSTSATSYANCTGYGFATTSAATAAASHYHVGNLYQWNAATAGSGGTTVLSDGEAKDSICPRGWRLPTSNTDGEFQVLSNTYQITSGTGTSGTVQTLLNAPFYFVRGGYVDSGTLVYAGNVGYYWSSTPYSNSSYAYSLYFYSTSDIDPSDRYGRRYRGFSVRCVAGS